MEIADIESIKLQVFDAICSDIGAPEFEKDPLGYTIYGYVLLKNSVQSQETANIIDLLNLWVDKIVKDKEVGEFLDRDVTSGLFAYYVLKEHGKLKSECRDRDVIQLSNQYFNRSSHNFFDNLFYSLLVGLSLSESREQIDWFSDLVSWIRSKIDEEVVYNDMKNVAFAILLFNKLQDEKYTNSILDACLYKLKNHKLRNYDELYAAWIIWNNRTKYELTKESRKELREGVTGVLDNSTRMLRSLLEARTPKLEKEYEVNLRKKPSRIWLAALYDLLLNFRKHTVIATEEIEWPIRIAGFISGISIIVITTISSFMAINSGFIGRPTTLLQAGVNFIFALLACLVLAISYAFIWDMGVRGAHTGNEMKNSLKSAIKTFILGGLLLGLLSNLLSLLTGI